LQIHLELAAVPRHEAEAVERVVAIGLRDVPFRRRDVGFNELALVIGEVYVDVSYALTPYALTP